MEFKHRERTLLNIALLILLQAGHCFSTQEIILQKTLGDSAFRHSASLIDILPLPDGKRALTSADDGSVRLWDLATGKELRRYVHKTHSYVWDIFLLPDGKSFLTGGNSRNVRQWDIEDGTSQIVCEWTNTVFRVARSPDAKLLAIGSANECVVWDIAKKAEVFSFALGNKEDAYSVCFLSKGAQVMAGFDDHGAVVKKISDESTVFQLPKECNGVYSIVPSPDRKHLLACTAKKGLMCLKTDPLTSQWDAIVGNSDIYSAAWSPDGSKVAVVCQTANGNNSMHSFLILDAATGATILTQPINPAGSHYGIAFSTDGKQILCGSGNVLCKFDAATGERLFPTKKDDFFRNSAHTWLASPSSLGMLLTTKSGNGLQMIDPATGTNAGVWHADIPASEVAVSPDGKLIAAAGDSRIFVMDVEKDKTVTIIDAENSIRSMAIDGSNSKLITQGYSSASLYRLPSGNLEASMNDFKQLYVSAMAQQRDGPLIAFCAKSLIKVMDTGSRRVIGEVSTPMETGSLTFFPAGGSALLASAGTNLYLWNSATGEKKVSEKKVRKAIERLAAKKFKDRESATEFLIDQGSQAMSELGNINSSDPEVKDRVARITQAILSQKVFGQTTDIASCGSQGFSQLVAHPSLPLWIALTSHPSDTRIVLGDIKNGKIRILSETKAPNGPSWITFGRDDIIYTANGNGTIDIYKIRGD